jgi:hypothetical protein
MRLPFLKESGPDKAACRHGAQTWWKSEAAASSRARGFAVCGKCGQQLRRGQGYVARARSAGGARVSPGLYCEGCYDTVGGRAP